LVIITVICGVVMAFVRLSKAKSMAAGVVYLPAGAAFAGGTWVVLAGGHGAGEDVRARDEAAGALGGHAIFIAG